MVTITNSTEETIRLGKDLAKGLSKGDVISLSGDLGSGKTTFTKGIGEGLGMKSAMKINSPSFVLIKEYKGRIPIYHMDLYRLDNVMEVEDIGIEEYIYGDGVTVIEWGDKIKELLPEKTIVIRFKMIGDNKREISVEDNRD
ncbi:MAG: tRNA (adenosine(37)-N6)-threonylcarbamoyltransferase complex ATPase subunit type 1 TsaE [Candidatus Omnitrophota bacterium]